MTVDTAVTPRVMLWLKPCQQSPAAFARACAFWLLYESHSVSISIFTLDDNNHCYYGASRAAVLRLDGDAALRRNTPSLTCTHALNSCATITMLVLYKSGTPAVTTEHTPSLHPTCTLSYSDTSLCCKSLLFSPFLSCTLCRLMFACLDWVWFLLPVLWCRHTLDLLSTIKRPGWAEDKHPDVKTSWSFAFASSSKRTYCVICLHEESIKVQVLETS